MTANTIAEDREKAASISNYLVELHSIVFSESGRVTTEMAGSGGVPEVLGRPRPSKACPTVKRGIRQLHGKISESKDNCRGRRTTLNTLNKE